MMNFITKHWRALFISCCVIFSSAVFYFFFEMPLEKVVFRLFLLISILALLYNYQRIAWLAPKIDDYLEAKRVEKHHWAHDKDLQLIKKVRYVLWLMCFVLLGIGLYKLKTTDPEYVYECMLAGMKAHEFYSEAYLYIKLAYAVFMLDAIVFLVCNIHIAACRNPITPHWVYKVCLDCARFGMAAGALYTISQITADQMPHSQVTDVANVYNSVSPTGRGYGYDTVSAKELDRELQSLKSYNSWDHVKTTPGCVYNYKEIDHESMQKWAVENRTEVRSQISLVNRQRHNLP